MLRLGRPGYRLLCVAGALLTVPVGLVTALGKLAAVSLVLVVLLSMEGYRALGRQWSWTSPTGPVGS